MFTFVVLDSVFSTKPIGRQERLQNDPFCVEWDVKHSTQSVNQSLEVKIRTV